MLVEFLDDDVFGPSLYVSQQEFAKAAESEDELSSLRNAINAYMVLWDFDYFGLDKDIYTWILQQLSKGSSLVVTTATSNTIPVKSFFQFIVVRKGRHRVIIDWDGYSYVRVPV